MIRSYCVYLVECKDKSYYCGVTTNVERRLRQHNGEIKGGAKYTRSKGPVYLAARTPNIYTQSEACKIEYIIKQLKKQDKINYLEGLQ